MLRNKYMTTGEFAKVMKVTKHTLFHYDDIGLFCPEIVTEQNYRYYSLDQMERFNTIMLLKDLGMSLEEIRDFLSDRSTEKFLDVFEKREQQIDIEIAKLKATKKWMKQRRRKLIEARELDYSVVEIKHAPRRFYLFEYVEDTSSQAFNKKINELVTRYESYQTGNDYDIAYIQHARYVGNNIYDAYDNIALLLEDKPPRGEYETLPEGDYLTAYHIGHWQTIGEAYQRLFQYQEEHGLITDEEYLEYYVVDDFTAESMDNYVTEISVRVTGGLT